MPDITDITAYYLTSIPHTCPGRFCDLQDEDEIINLEYGMDFRHPRFRREVFHRFYDFHLKYRSHPGGVYFLMRYLPRTLGWDFEQKLWFAFLNGNTQHPPTSLLIFKRFPDFKNLDITKLTDFFNKEWKRLEFDTDRRHQKSDFLDSVKCYQKLTQGDQESFFADICNTGDVYENFRKLWKIGREKFYSFGRLSTFSYLEYLRIMRVPIDCDRLFLEDMSGSKSHRNGLAKVLGRDDLDWHDSNETKFEGKYTPEILGWLEKEAATLLNEAKIRNKDKHWETDVSYFTLESTFCTYKSWHRPNRRYPNVYMDMLYNRIKKAELRWPEENFSIFWDARKFYLPLHLRLEDNLQDPGLCPEKQNHYRNTGQVIMMRDFDNIFDNDFERRYYGSLIKTLTIP